MKLFRRAKKWELHPIPPAVMKAHHEAIAVKEEQERKAPMFEELAENMRHRHRLNGFGEKLETTYQGKGLL